MGDVFVGRAGPLTRLAGALDDAFTGRTGLAFVSGEAGIGKSSVLSRAAAEADARGALVAWGTGWDSASAPAFWLWTQVLRAVITPTLVISDADRAELGRLVPEVGSDGRSGEASDLDRARFELFDAVARLLDQVARAQPLVVIFDDLHWADVSSLLLLDFVARQRRPLPLLLIGGYRHNELASDARDLLSGLAAQATHVQLDGLSTNEVRVFLASMTTAEVADRRADELQRRTRGHPFFVRELARQIADGCESAEVPGAVRDAVRARLRRLDAAVGQIVEVAAVAGSATAIDVLADVSGTDVAVTAGLIGAAVDAGVLVRDTASGVAFTHDLFRETVEADLAPLTRLRLHQRLGAALETRVAVEPGEVARHLIEAIPLDGTDRAVEWAMAASDADRRRLAFAEAASHLRRAREAIVAARLTTEVEGTIVDLLVAEADVAGRAGEPERARQLLADAHAGARRLVDARRLAAVALGLQHLGARFAMPRDATITLLEEARAAIAGGDPRLHAQVTASLARELHHSVPAQRARAGPLSEDALRVARDLDDPATLAGCLLARHDVLWSVGLGAERVTVARELLAVAECVGDAERRCEALLLVANALLETGSAAFRPLLTEYVGVAEGLGPRHAYYALTRRAMLALLDGDLDAGGQLVEEAAACGERIGEPDAGNVRMSQTLEVVRARGLSEDLAATAQDAVQWWVGVPSHAYAVAAGFSAQAGDLALARRSLDVVIELDQWRDDRSYLWGVFVGQLATAAVMLDDRKLAEALLRELAPVAESCTVNGAAVCFMGAHAHWAGVLSAALDRHDEAEDYLRLALAMHERLGAAAWVAETSAELAMLLGSERGALHLDRARTLATQLGLAGISARLHDATRPSRPDAVLARQGAVWELRYRNQRTHLRDAKGLRDLAVLVTRPGIDVHVLELAAERISSADGTAVLDERAKREFRRRLADLESELAEADANNDLSRHHRIATEREALLDELRRAAGLGGRDRHLGGNETEKARKAVAARLRDSIGRIAHVIPEVGAHLDRSITTGTYCRYQPTEPIHWDVTP